MVNGCEVLEVFIWEERGNENNKKNGEKLIDLKPNLTRTCSATSASFHIVLRLWQRMCQSINQHGHFLPMRNPPLAGHAMSVQQIVNASPSVQDAIDTSHLQRVRKQCPVRQFLPSPSKKQTFAALRGELVARGEGCPRCDVVGSFVGVLVLPAPVRALSLKTARLPRKTATSWFLSRKACDSAVTW